MNTVLLRDFGYDYKSYFRLKTPTLYNKNVNVKHSILKNASVNLIYLIPNSIVLITNFTETEYELPSNPKIGDSIVFFIDPFIIDNLLNVNFDSFPKIKIYRNKKRIMGLEENLICDRPFQSLKLSFYTEEDGWIIV